MIKSVEITDFCGLKTVKIDCKKFNVFCGRSDQGKSTILKAIEWAITGGDDEFLVRNGCSSTEVILNSDNGTRIERRMKRGEKSKLSIYRGDTTIAKPQTVLNKAYSPLTFNPVKMVTMSPKELNQEIVDALGKRLKLNEHQIEEYGLNEIKEEILKSENLTDTINAFYKKKYDLRTEQNKIIKNMSAKMDGIDTSVTEEEVQKLEDEINELSEEIAKAVKHNSVIEVSSQNTNVRNNALENIKILELELEKVSSIKLEELETTHRSLKLEFDKANNKLTSIRNSVRIKTDVISKIAEGVTKCPISDDIVCNTNMSTCKSDIENDITKLKLEATTLFKECEKRNEELRASELTIETAKSAEKKKTELERLKSLVDQLKIVDGEIIPVKPMQNKLDEKRKQHLSKKLALELKNVSSLDDMKKIQEKLDDTVKNLQKLINEVIPNMLKLNVKDVVLSKEGIFFKGLPFSNLGDSVKLRICTAILKDMFKRSNIYNLDGLECIDKNSLKKYVEYYGNEDNDIQYFGTYVNSVDFISQSPKIKIFNVEGFEVK